jgi:hypothetical protein
VLERVLCDVRVENCRWPRTWKECTGKRHLASKHYKSFSELLLLYPQLSSLCLHAPPGYDEADALPTNVHGLCIFELGGGLDNVGLPVSLALRPTSVILVVLESKVKVVLVARIAEVLPNACSRISTLFQNSSGSCSPTRALAENICCAGILARAVECCSHRKAREYKSDASRNAPRSQARS